MRTRGRAVATLLIPIAVAACGGSDDAKIESASASGAGGDAAGVGGGSSSGGGSASGGAGAGGPIGTIGPDVISTSTLTAFEAETHVWAADNGFTVVAYIGIRQDGFSTNGYRFSKDWGTTWEPADSLDSPGGRVASDPVLVADAQNNFYMTWIGYQFGGNGQPTDMHVYVAIAPAGTTKFGSPIDVSGPPTGADFDKPWIAITNKGSILVTYAKTSTGGIFAARSADGGASWTSALIVEDGGFRNLVYPCPPPTGDRVYATYHAGGGIGLRWSDDDGVTWPDANKTAVADMNEQPAFDDPTCAADASDVWITYGLSNDAFGQGDFAKLNHIRFAHSTDGGVTIASRIDIQDSSAGQFFLHPQLVREPTGVFDLVYYAGNGDNDAGGTYRRTRSSDGGATWEATMLVKSPITYLQSRSSPKWLGDYTGLAWHAGALFTSFVDNTADFSHVAFYRTQTQ